MTRWVKTSLRRTWTTSDDRTSCSLILVSSSADTELQMLRAHTTICTPSLGFPAAEQPARRFHLQPSESNRFLFAARPVIGHVASWPLKLEPFLLSAHFALASAKSQG
jgi:hypothetical protein